MFINLLIFININQFLNKTISILLMHRNKSKKNNIKSQKLFYDGFYSNKKQNSSYPM